MAPKPEAQTALDEKIIEDSDFEKVLEDRERAKGAAGEARKKYGTLDELAKGKVEELGLEDGDAARVGRFRITKTRVEPRNVSFETGPSSRVTISPSTED